MSLRTRQPRLVLASLAAALAATVVACATNPATGKKEFSLMSEAQEVQLGQEMDPQIKQEMGVYDDAELQRYVSGVGMRLAKSSERPHLPWTEIDLTGSCFVERQVQLPGVLHPRGQVSPHLFFANVLHFDERLRCDPLARVPGKHGQQFFLVGHALYFPPISASPYTQSKSGGNA